jgi:hypothetical protein
MHCAKATDGRLATGDQVRIRGNLLKQMALACAARAKLDHVVVALDKRHHPQERDQLGPIGQRTRLQSNRPDQKVAPFHGGEGATPLGQHIQHF